VYRLSKWARRHKTLLAAGSAVSLAVLVGLVGTAWGLRTALREGERARDAERAARIEAQNALVARHRLPAGEWIGYEVTDHQSAEGVAIGHCVLHDIHGPVGFSSCAGLAQKRKQRPA
jgi:Flp pilus assembly protein CpaB